MPFQRPVRPAKTRSRASLSALAAGNMPTLAQLAARKFAGCCCMDCRTAWAASGNRKTARMAIRIFRAWLMGDDEAWWSDGNMAAATPPQWLRHCALLTLTVARNGEVGVTLGAAFHQVAGDDAVSIHAKDGAARDLGDHIVGDQRVAGARAHRNADANAGAAHDIAGRGDVAQMP